MTRSILIAYGMTAILTLFTAGVLAKFAKKFLPGRYFWPFAFGTSMAVWGTGSFFWNWIGGRLSPGGTAGIFLVLAFGVWANRQAWMSQGPTFSRPITWERPVMLCGVILGACVLTTWIQASSLPIYHLDAMAHFAVDAKALFLDKTYRTLFFFGKGIVHSQPDYPLFVPYLEAGFFRLCGFVDDLAVKHLFLIFWLGWLTLLYQALRIRMSRRDALILTTLFVSLPLFYKDDETQIVSGCADIPFSFYWTAFVLSGAHWLKDRRPAWGAFLVLFSATATLAKPQGLPICLAAWAILWLFAPRESRSKVAWAFAGYLLVSFPWLITQHHLPREMTFPPITLSMATLPAALSRIVPLLRAYLREIIAVSWWGVFWVAFIASCVVASKSQAKDTERRYILSCLAAQFAIYAAVYLVSSQSIDWWVASSLTRWLVHGSGLILIVTGWSFAVP